MTREEAIEVIKGEKKSLQENTALIVDSVLYEAYDMAIKTLEQEPSEDLISRQAVLEKQYRIDDSATLSTRDVVNVDDIEDLPSVNPQEPKTGHWEYIQYDKPSIGNWHCSECRETFPVDCSKWNYCPNCGCAMVESQESEEDK